LSEKRTPALFGIAQYKIIPTNMPGLRFAASQPTNQENHMAIKAKVKKGTTHLTIEDEMTIYTALEQKNDLSQYLKPDGDLQINLANVTEIDGAGLQILLFIKQEAARLNFKFSLIQHSQAVVEVLELLDLGSHFGDPIVISADWGKS
jgi:anti-anti-sigma factor